MFGVDNFVCLRVKNEDELNKCFQSFILKILSHKTSNFCVSLMDKNTAAASYGSSFCHLKIHMQQQNKTSYLLYLEIALSPLARCCFLNLPCNMLFCCSFHINITALWSCTVAENGFTEILLATWLLQT